VNDAVKIGTVTDNNRISINGKNGLLIDGTVEEFRSAWKGAIQCLLNSEA
jgi:hypothetical protein